MGKRAPIEPPESLREQMRRETLADHADIIMNRNRIVVAEQVGYWRRNRFSPRYCLMLLTSSPRRPQQPRDREADWGDVWEVALDAYGEVSQGRMVNLCLFE